MSDTEVVLPDEIQTAKDAVEELRESPPLQFDGGRLQIHPTDVTGKHERWMRRASDGYITSGQQLFGLMGEGSYEAAGALYWIAWLEDAGLAPGDDGALSYDEALDQIDIEAMTKVASAMVADPS